MSKPQKKSPITSWPSSSQRLIRDGKQSGSQHIGIHIPTSWANTEVLNRHTALQSSKDILISPTDAEQINLSKLPPIQQPATQELRTIQQPETSAA
ncbi:hypothetical protein E4U51_007686 [Claviceps purpurea]|nr:hypothetical protein E4U51_007686 [Claviceps purpurea]